jgi:hypothetical protein
MGMVVTQTVKLRTDIFVRILPASVEHVALVARSVLEILKTAQVV